jgi:hypothetical protein
MHQIEEPKTGNKLLISIMKLCLDKDPNKRPKFSKVSRVLQKYKEKRNSQSIKRKLSS